MTGDPAAPGAGVPSPPSAGRDAQPSLFQHRSAGPHEPIRTFHPRRSALGPARDAALRDLWPALGFLVHEPDADARTRRDDGGPSDPGPAPARSPWRPDRGLDHAALFGRCAPLVLEIGSGMGEAVAAMAAADPARDYLAVEAHLPGIANLLRLIKAAGLTNVRVAFGDALELLRRRVDPDSLDAIHVFFPDPWPKPRHHRRRLVQPDHVALLRSRLVPGGTLHCATDWPPYADVMLAALTADPELVNAHRGLAPRPPHRPVTRFEQRGLDLGHTVADIVVTRSRRPSG